MIGWVVERSGGLSKSNKCNIKIKGLLWHAGSVAKRIWLYFVKQFESIEESSESDKNKSAFKIPLCDNF